MKISLGQENVFDNVYDQDDKDRIRIRAAIRDFIKRNKHLKIRCVGKYKNGLSMDFCQVCAEENILEEIVVPYEDNDSCWPDPIKNKFELIAKKSRKVVLLSRGGFNPKKLKEMDLYIQDKSDLIININRIRSSVQVTIERKK
jgi:hypothetical protein